MESKQEFAKAFGLKAMIDSGLVSPEEAKAKAKVSYQVVYFNKQLEQGT